MKTVKVDNNRDGLEMVCGFLLNITFEYHCRFCSPFAATSQLFLR